MNEINRVFLLNIIESYPNMASHLAKVDQMKYLKYANPYNFLALVLAAVLFLIFVIFV